MKNIYSGHESLVKFIQILCIKASPVFQSFRITLVANDFHNFFNWHFMFVFKWFNSHWMNKPVSHHRCIQMHNLVMKFGSLIKEVIFFQLIVVFCNVRSWIFMFTYNPSNDSYSPKLFTFSRNFKNLPVLSKTDIASWFLSSSGIIFLIKFILFDIVTRYSTNTSLNRVIIKFITVSLVWTVFKTFSNRFRPF